MKAIIHNKVLLMWLMIFLLIANLSAMITVYYKIQQHKNLFQFSDETNQMYRGQGPGMSIIRILHFTPDQMSKFKTIRDDHLNKMNLLEQDLFDLREEIVHELTSENPNKVKLNEIADKFGEVQAELKKQSFDHYIKVKEICTEDQKEIFNSRIKNIVDEQQRPGPGFHYRHRHGKNRNLNF